MRTVIILRAFEVDAPTPTHYAAGDTVSVADATASEWIAKGLARAKPAPRPAAKSSPKSAD